MGVSQGKADLGKNVQVPEEGKCEGPGMREKMTYIFGKPKAVHFVGRGGWWEINLEK